MLKLFLFDIFFIGIPIIILIFILKINRKKEKQKYFEELKLKKCSEYTNLDDFIDFEINRKNNYIITIPIILLTIIFSFTIIFGLRKFNVMETLKARRDTLFFEKQQANKQTMDYNNNSNQNINNNSSQNITNNDQNNSYPSLNRQHAQDAMNNPNGYILKNSNTEYLSKLYLEGFTKEQLDLARNEIFARHGYNFVQEPYKSYFNSKKWYHNTNNENISLNSYEAYNLQLIESYENTNFGTNY